MLMPTDLRSAHITDRGLVRAGGRADPFVG
jgi:hypothetical protein